MCGPTPAAGIHILTDSSIAQQSAQTCAGDRATQAPGDDPGLFLVQHRARVDDLHPAGVGVHRLRGQVPAWWRGSVEGVDRAAPHQHGSFVQPAEHNREAVPWFPHA